MPRYNATVRDHAGQPRNVGEIPGVPYGEGGRKGEGPYMRLWLRIEGGMVTDVAFRTYGCPASIASGSMVTELIRGQNVEHCLAISSRDVLQALGGLPLGKTHCAGLAVTALRDALRKAGARQG